MTSTSRNQGLAQKRFEQLRRQDATPGPASAYEAAGIVRALQGDDDAPFFKAAPFATTGSNWHEHTFTAGEYVFLTPLDIGNVRNVITYFTVTGGTSDASVLSIVAGAVIPGVDTITSANLEAFFPIGVVDSTPTNVTLGTPFSAPAISRDVLTAEFRTPVIPDGDISRFVLQWDVSGYTRFTLALADTGFSAPGSGLSMKVQYGFSN